ncbi:hypothetical protein [Paludisphaera mucosa]|uniref:Uncharacterized protein n=1 Tax=Paludisphaera mucosa TaxID=3030827 RepID=A0ABT6FJB2_9BACT|nr:hypothetical protein [Paludisphaera mucosa]MDG3007586.1 hypothetical protein [Paludisphaera mucosa]
MLGYTLILHRRSTGRAGRIARLREQSSTVLPTLAAAASQAAAMLARLFDDACTGRSRPIPLGLVAAQPPFPIGIPGRATTTGAISTRRGGGLG